MRALAKVIRILCVLGFITSILVMGLMVSDEMQIRRWAKARGTPAVTVSATVHDGPFHRERLLTRIYRVKTADRMPTDGERNVYWLKFAPGERPRAVLKPPVCRCPTPEWIGVDAPGGER